MIKKILASVFCLFLLVCSINAQTVVFSDSGKASETIERAINNASNTVWVAMYSFSDYRLANALINAANRNVFVSVVADKSQSLPKYSCIPMLMKTLGTNNVVCINGHGGASSIMHNKFAVIDSKIVITGSYNWSKKADKANFENYVIINNKAIAAQYEIEFVKMAHQRSIKK